MARLASPADFEAGVLYTDYRRYPFFAVRADRIVERFPTANRILVAGCGWGFLVDELIRRGKTNTWGADAAQYCKDRAQELVITARRDNPAEMEFSFEVSTRILVIDCSNRDSLASARTAMGLTGSTRLDLIVTEDCLSVCNSEAECQTWLREARRITNAMCHILTPGNTGDPNDMAVRYPGLLWRTIPEWQAIVGSATEPILETGTYQWHG